MMVERIKNEPVLVVGCVQAILALVVAFGLNLSDGQVAAILGVTGAVLALVARSKVSPVKSDGV